MRELLLILPTRGRPQKVEASITSWRETTSGRSDLLIRLDNDDPTLTAYKRHEDVLYRVGDRLRVCPTVNEVVEENPGYLYYAFMGDDHVIRTQKWEDIAIQKIQDNGGWGIVYGNDLFQGERLATAAIMSANIPQTLGYMALPGTTHLYMDNFWMEIGRGINKLFYIPEIIMEHMHYEAGKSVKDTQYAEVNSPEMYSHDGAIFSEWVINGKQQNIEKLLLTQATCYSQIVGFKNIITSFFGYKKDGVFIEAGAFDGQTHSNVAGLADLGWQGYFIEPVPEFALLCEKRHKNNNVTTLQMALGEEDGTVNISVAGEISSAINDPNDFYNTVGLPQFHDQHVGNLITVQQKTLDSICKIYNLPIGFDILSLDTEGTEWQILKNFPLAYWQPRMVIIEMHEDSLNWTRIKSVKEDNLLLNGYFVSSSYKKIYQDTINTIFIK